MPFQDTKEGQTHHDKDACYKCKRCGSHYDDNLLINELCVMCFSNLPEVINFKQNEIS